MVDEVAKSVYAMSQKIDNLLQANSFLQNDYFKGSLFTDLFF